MSEIIRKWLTKRLGLVLDVNPESIANACRDGRLFAELLFNYNIIRYDQYQQYLVAVAEQSTTKWCHYILQKYIANWLRNLNVICNDEVLHDIASGKTSAALKLLYHVYLKVQDRNSLYFVKEEVRQETIKRSNSRFSVTLVAEGDVEDNRSTLAAFEKKKDVVRWCKDRYHALVERCKDAREKYLNYLEKNLVVKTQGDKQPLKMKKDICCGDQIDLPPVKDVGFQVDDYEQLLEDQERVRNLKPFVPNLLEAKKCVKRLQEKSCKEAEMNELKRHAQNTLVVELWERINEQNKNLYEDVISKKLLKQSVFEKQMVAKMLEIRRQKDVMLENKALVASANTQQCDADLLQASYLETKHIEDAKFKYYLEKSRLLELHRRLYDEKKRLKAERNYQVCKEVAEDIVNISLKHSEFREFYEEEVPERIKAQWNSMFVKQLPESGFNEKVVDIVQDLDDLPEDLESLYCAELSSQEALDDKSFEDYQTFQYPWDLEMITEEIGDVKEVLDSLIRGDNILGFIVHKMLWAKYPKPKKPEAPILPPTTVAACVIGINDETILPLLQKLLEAKKIKVIELHAAINFCINAYNNETLVEPVGSVSVEDIKTVEVVEKPKQTKQKPPKKGSKNVKKQSIETSDMMIGRQYTNEMVQTPLIFPDEEVVLSQKAMLGKVVHETLLQGETPTDYLLAAIFLEYIKPLDNFNGWVLMNYPLNMRQAAILEEYLTGVPMKQQQHRLAHTSLYDFAELEKKPSNEAPKQDKRKSLLLPNPEPIDDGSEYETYLTAFINAIYELYDESGVLLDECLGPDVDEELCEFYTQQGCNYEFRYRCLDFITIKSLAKLIIGEFSIPPKTSVELFGDTVLYMQEELNKSSTHPSVSKLEGKKKEDKKMKLKAASKVSLPKGAESIVSIKGKRSKSKTKSMSKIKIIEQPVVFHADKETQIPETIPEEFESIESEPVIEALPGDEAWRYVDLPMDVKFQEVLATFWENAEKIYINDIKQVFFIKRVLQNAVVPYLHNVTTYLSDYIKRPDNKQDFLYEIQKMMNDIDEDLRDDFELKAEFHCRLNEFKEKLFGMADRRMVASEEERCRNIKENWVFRQICETSNAYVSLYQIEIDRFIDSLRLLNDYYSFNLTRNIPVESGLRKLLLERLDSGCEENVPISMISYAEAVEELLKNPEATWEESPFLDFLKTTHSICEKCMESSGTLCLNQISKLNKMLSPKSVTTGSKKDNKDDKNKIEPDQDVKENLEKIFLEWTYAIEAERTRLKVRLELIKTNAIQDIKDIQKSAQKTYHQLYENIKDYYNNETNSIETAIHILSQALEAETQLQPQLVLDGDKFYVDPNVILFPDELPKPSQPVKEKIKDIQFTVSQLSALADILMDIAPNGIILAASFSYLLQDLMAADESDGSESVLPKHWMQLKPEFALYVTSQFFGTSEYINWKDFIVYNLGVSFPDETELMHVRKLFRENDPDVTEYVKEYHFLNTPFWFDVEFDLHEEEQCFRHKKMKELLFKLYKVDEETLNYTALLLQFCKDEDPVLGVVKALELSIGKYICWEDKIGRQYKENWLKLKKEEERLKEEKEMELKENIEAIRQELALLADNVVHICDSTVVEELHESESSTNEILQITESETATDSAITEESNTPIESYPSIIMENSFSNVEIAFEAALNPPLVYLLPFDVLLTVMAASLPWHFRVENIEDASLRDYLQVIYDECRDPDFNNQVFVHEFLNHEFFKGFLETNYKFAIVDPEEVLSSLLYSNKE